MLRAARHLLAYHPNASGRDMYDDDRLKGFGDDAQSLVDEHDLDTVLMQADDATWILSSAFMILTMQSGFTMLEKGYLPPKHTINTMLKNVVDVTVGGAMFWCLGFGLGFGEEGNSFMGMGDFFFQPKIKGNNVAEQTDGYANWLFHFAFASTATTIVSGSVAGRMKMSAYTSWAFLSPMAYAIVAHWVWADDGWLAKRSFADFAGDGPVHLYGACGALAGVICVGARKGRFNDDGTRGKNIKEIYEPESVIAGTLILWWGWIGFNCGSTFGTTGIKASVATRVGVVTVVATIAGAVTELIKVFLPSARKKVLAKATSISTAGQAVSRAASVRVMKRWSSDSNVVRWHEEEEGRPRKVSFEGMPEKEEEEARPQKVSFDTKEEQGDDDDDDESPTVELTKKAPRGSLSVLWRMNSSVNRPGDNDVGRPGTNKNHRGSVMQIRESFKTIKKKVFMVEDNRIKVPGLTNAILSALVAITAPCNVVVPRMAIIIGAVAPFIANAANNYVERMGYDDPCGAIGVHGAAGVWGLVSVGLFSKGDLPGNDVGAGFVYQPSVGIQQVWIQLYGALAIIAWGVGINVILFKLVEYVTESLRVNEEDEEKGLDSIEHATTTLYQGLAKRSRQTSNRVSTQRAESSIHRRRPTSMPIDDLQPDVQEDLNLSQAEPAVSL